MTHRVGRVGIGRDWIAEIEVWEEAIAEEGRKLTMGMFGRARDQTSETIPLTSQTAPSYDVLLYLWDTHCIQAARNEGEIVLAADRTPTLLLWRGEPVGGD